MWRRLADAAQVRLADVVRGLPRRVEAHFRRHWWCVPAMRSLNFREQASFSQHLVSFQRNGQPVELKESFQQHLDEFWLEFARDVLASFLVHGLAAVVIDAAPAPAFGAAKAKGADRFCMGAAWRSLKDRDVEKICDIVTSVKAEGLETCMTLGMLEEGAGGTPRRRRARLLQPQSRYLSRVLRQGHHHPDL